MREPTIIKKKEIFKTQNPKDREKDIVQILKNICMLQMAK